MPEAFIGEIRIALLLALLAAVGCGPACSRGAGAETFSLALSHDVQEISRDSNEQRTEIAVEGRRVTYTWTYSGFHPDPDFRRQIRKRTRLSQAQVDAIQETIRGRDLLRDLEEIQPIEGPGIAVDVDLAIEMAGQTATVRIAGMQRIDGASAARTNLAHAATVADVEALVAQVRSIVGHD